MTENKKSSTLITPTDSLQPLQQYFNQNSDRLRFLALLSPT
jgi:hypothetical protein